MTVSTTTLKVSYSGNGSTAAFAYTFKVFAQSELKVIIRSSAGVETTKTLTTHYTVSGVGSASGGNVTFTSGNIPASGETVVILRDTPLTQATDYVENDPFPAASHMDALDKLTHITQEMQEELDRTLKVSKTVTDLTTPEFSEDAAARADKLLAFDDDGDELTVTTGRVSSVSISTSNVAVSNGASQSGTGSAAFTSSTGALALTLGLPVGNTGMMGGVSMQYSTTTTDSDPGSGFIRFNNTSLNSATLLYIDDSDGTNDISAWVATWDDSNSATAGYLTIAGNPNTSSPLVIYKVTGLTDATGYTKVNVTYVAGTTSISNNAEVSVSFAHSGDVAQSGLHFKFDTGTSNADPGAGELAFNHGTPSSVTVLYVDDADQNSVDVSAFVQSWDDGNDSNKGYVRIEKRGTPSTYALFKVNAAVTDESGWTQVPVAYVIGSGTFSAADSLDVNFTKNGDLGAAAGIHLTYSTTTTDSDPGSGVIRFNNSTLASATIAYIDDADADGGDIEALVLSWDDSTTTSLRGTITMRKRTNPSVYAIWNITGASTDASGYSKLALTYVTGTGSFSDTDPIALHFTRTGNKGADGSDASDVFKTISVSGQDDVVADAATDTLTLAGAGTVAITTNASSDTITFTGTAGSFTAAGDSGSNQTINTGNTLTIAGGSGISTTGSATDTITIAGDDASTSSKGVAQFSSDNFAASSGTITIKSAGIDLTDEVTGSLPNANLATVGVAKGGTNLTSYTAGDLVYASAGTTIAKLGIGSAGQILKVNSGENAPEWGSAASSDLVDDTSPQLGGQLDVNGQAIGNGTLELLKFSETGSAVNEFTIANAATGNNPTFSATGDDTNIGINITPKGSGSTIISGSMNDTISTTGKALVLGF